MQDEKNTYTPPRVPHQLNVFDLEVDADGGDEGGGKGLAGIAEQQARL